MNEYLVNMRMYVDCLIESYVLKSDLHSMSKKEVNRLLVIDYNWDNNHASVGDDITLHVDIDVLISMNNEFEKINAIEITGISDGTCLYCPDYPEDDDYDDFGDDV